MFIMLDGIDGSGKSTIIEAWKYYLAKEGNTIFDLKEYWLKNGRHPDFKELKPYDFIVSAEPTEVGVGKVIREELVKTGTNYPPLGIAEAYSLDRLILYTKIIIPALRSGKCVIQDRGISSSLAYQPLSDKKLSVKAVSALPGNQLALRHTPSHLVLVDVPAELAIKRLAERGHKKDDVIFEKLTFQKKLANIYRSSAFKKIFTSRGTVVLNLPGEDKIDIMKDKAVELLKNILQADS